MRFYQKRLVLSVLFYICNHAPRPAAVQSSNLVQERTTRVPQTDMYIFCMGCIAYCIVSAVSNHFHVLLKAADKTSRNELFGTLRKQAHKLCRVGLYTLARNKDKAVK